MNFPVFSQLAGNLAFRDEFARDCLLQRRVMCEPVFFKTVAQYARGSEANRSERAPDVRLTLSAHTATHALKHHLDPTEALTRDARRRAFVFAGRDA